MITAILTRPRSRISQTAQVYQAAGIDVYLAPVFEIRANPLVRPEWLNMPADTWVVLSVHALHHALALAPDLRPQQSTRVIAVGPAVARAWRAHFSHPVEHHPWMNSEGVIEVLKAHRPQAVKILTNRDGRGLVKHHCMSAGISYQQINVYERQVCRLELDELARLYAQGQPVLTATSADILKAFAAQLNTVLLQRAQQAPVVVGADRIAQVAAELGFQQVIQADSPADEAMCAAVQATSLDN